MAVQGINPATGAKRLLGGHTIEGDGYFYRPGILIDISEDAPAYGLASIE